MQEELITAIIELEQVKEELIEKKEYDLAIKITRTIGLLEAVLGNKLHLAPQALSHHSPITTYTQ